MINFLISDYILCKCFGDFLTKIPRRCSGIYLILCQSNGNFYIGSAVDIGNRFCTHRRKLNAGKHHSTYLQNSYDKYGANNFHFYLIERVLDAGLLVEKEQFYLDIYNPVFNMSPTAGSSLGMIRSDATKKKLREINLGKKLTPENREIAIRNLRRNKKGLQRHSVETKLKMSKTRQIRPPMGMLGKKHSNETIKKIIEAGSKTYTLINPQGQEVSITNLALFCRLNGLQRPCMYNVHAGKQISHKGWKKPITQTEGWLEVIRKQGEINE